ncbi:hypothetical protein SEA_YEET_101 [Mycobacterium phage Yeet]|uniref:hypothetical protein n=1 Tax=Mycobacterium phage Minerva TaxID=1527513 RepID=UPI0004EF8CAE|nr:hypothetical protein VC71_gp109 [Mycobacterium phage Minerva]QCO93794.1 hypothetical protein SEA_SCHATZIE_104 [Mycobacterium phage Schatzie]QDM55685.1 hypothetical protein SEA_HOKKEND_99 [Mycobacterium phage HokkenD]QDM57928.1 hypothetical protein SEA_NIHILNOMEN_111 [Mycobacterium phage NihilNomen]QED12254.1 hypothetical protein SEA_YEET_101 [Mycobacterium phage Yeet]WNM72659.1 hypothetical protein SEA_BOMBITAS_98 [Mycobacterium phage Bombitas]
MNDADEKEALVRNALQYLAAARSTVIDHLTGPNDLYAKVEILQDLDSVDHYLKKAMQ